MEPASLVLQDGSIYRGFSFGAESHVSGEVVFNTGMVGYAETITDPSYKGQILCQTYPLIGNYGINREDFESDGPKIEGYVVAELCAQPSHHRMNARLQDILKEYNIPAICGVDTRALTKKLRMSGVLLGVLGTDEERLLKMAKGIEDPNNRDLVGEVSVKEPVFYEPVARKKTIVVIDCGVKMNIIRSLVQRGVHVMRVPASFGADKISSYGPDGVLISNGPGDPKKADYAIKTVCDLMEQRMPMFGICLGVQIMALALGADTYKLKFGHRAQNHPCMHGDRCYMTTQNHGFTIRRDTLPENVRVSFVNVNDKTVEGIEHATLPMFGVQFHPEHSPGPHDTSFLFDQFLRMIDDAAL